MLYEISDQTKKNIYILLDILTQKGISLNEVGAIHEIITILNNPVSTQGENKDE
jgi:hypothetical protein